MQSCVKRKPAQIVASKKRRLTDCAAAPITPATKVDTAPKDNIIFSPVVFIPKTIVAAPSTPPIKTSLLKISVKDFLDRSVVRKKNQHLINCDHCEFTSTKMQTMARHCNSNHPDSAENVSFTCFHCNRSFTQKIHLKRHILIIHMKRSRLEVEEVTCGICWNTYASKKGLRRHIFRQHYEAAGDLLENQLECPKSKFNYGYCCDICGRGYEKQFEMLAHRDVYHASSPPISWPAFQKNKRKMVGCTTCGGQFRTDRSARKHTCVTKEENAVFEERMTEALCAKPRFRCSICSFSSYWKVVLRQHWEKKHADAAPINWDELAAVEVPHYCIHCYTAFDEDAQLAKHFCAEMELEVRPKSYVCSVCDLSYQRKSTYRRHCQIRHAIFEANGEDKAEETEKPKPFIQCPYCEMTDTKRGRMVAHIKEAHNIETDSPFACVACCKVFQRKSNLDLHNQTYHPKDENMSAENERTLRENKILLNGEVTYHCHVCNRNFDLAPRFLAHHRLHFIERKYVCHLCGKQTHTQNHLQTHIKSFHLQIRNFVCDICNKGFYSKLICEQHRRIHTGERPFACEVCGKTFSSNSALLSHKKFHDDFFPHKCHLCPKKFKIRRCLTNHIRVHTGERPFRCELCFKTFSDPSRFSYHKKVTHSDERRVECKLCGKRYKAKKYLTRHMLKAHQTDKSDAVQEAK